MNVTVDWLVLLVMVIFIIGIIYTRIAAKYIDVTMDFPSVTFKKQMLQGELCVLFKKKILFGKMKIFLQFEHKMTGECLHMSCKTFVGAGETERNSINFGMKYSGKVVCTVEKMRIYDWFGIIYKTIYPNVKANILVMPEYTDCGMEEIVHLQDNLNGLQLIPHKSGYDYSEPAGIREYQQGDSMKSIHWKLTGREDKLFVKEASVPVEETVTIFAETIHEHTLAAPECDKLVSRLFSICIWLMERNITYKVCWYEKGKERLMEVMVESEQDVQRVLHKFMGCRQVQGTSSGKAYYKHLQGEKEFYYIA